MVMNNTVISEVGGVTTVTLYNTNIVMFNAQRIILSTGGHDTRTTLRRMNQVNDEFNLGFYVFIKNYSMYVTFKGVTYEFIRYDIELERCDAMSAITTLRTGNTVRV